jgi:UDP-glucose 6-dehydrogenase
MPIFCIPKHIAAKLKEAAANGEINIKALYEMNSQQRNEFWKKYVNEETAQFINSGFEKSGLD